MYNGMMYGWFYPISGGIPACGTPACGTPACGTPACGTPACGTPACGTPACGTPACGTPACGTPACGTPACGTPACGTPACGTPQLLPGDIKEGEALVAVWEYQLVSYLVPVQTLRKIKLRALGAGAEQTASDTEEEGK